MIAADSAVRSALAIEAALDPSSFPELSVGVLPFVVASSDSTLEPLGHGLADLLMTDLARSAQVQVVDRLRIDALLRELDLARSPQAAEGGPRAGRILGARHLVLGALAAERTEQVRVDASLALTETAAVRPILAGAASLDDILEAEKTVAFETLDALGVTLTPAERAAIEQRPTRSLAALLAFSRGVRAQAELQFSDARREFREAVRIDRSFRQAHDRLDELDAYFPDPFGVASISIDAINRQHLPPISDVADPAFQDQQRAILIIPIIIR